MQDQNLYKTWLGQVALVNIGHWRDLSLYMKFAAFQCISKICLNIWCAKHITNGIYRSTGLAFTWGLEKELAFSICWPVPIHQAEADREAGKCEARAFDPGCT